MVSYQKQREQCYTEVSVLKKKLHGQDNYLAHMMGNEWVISTVQSIKKRN